ncbi:MAG TPA: caspase family protein [Pirellulales bacterium]|jgi:hypothetical protein|nr:caspase family protein [Pirellulales bacterium]
MKNSSMIAGTLGGLLAFCSFVKGAQPPATSTLDPAHFHALLVGCTKYDNLPANKSLRGPANDVELMRDFLTDLLRHSSPDLDHFKLPPTAIKVLSEADATAQGDDFRPTRTNIEREIQNLIATAQEGDQVVILLAGHGGQQPEHKNPDPIYAKPDGLDQMFLPCDCGKWNGKKWCVDRSIADYELRDWGKQITLQKKARLWVILDACCSGWTMRGDSPEIARSISTDELGIPEADLQDAAKTALARQPAHQAAEKMPGNGDHTRGGGAVDVGFAFDPQLHDERQSPNYAGIYAAQRDESELEMRMPYRAADPKEAKYQGLLTYAIVDILSHTARKITYGELAELVRQRYPQWGRTAGPTPVVEGLAKDCEVLGLQRWPGRSAMRWRKDGTDGFVLNEGSVQGLTPGTVVALYPSIESTTAPSNEKELLGYAKVKHCELLESDVKLAAYSGMSEPRQAKLPAHGRFEVVWTDYGSQRLKLGVDAASGNLQQLSADLKAALAKEGLLEFVDDMHLAQWVVQMRDGKLVLLSKDAAEIGGTPPPEAALFSIQGQPTAEIVHMLEEIARAQNLLTLTAAQQTDKLRGAGQDDDPSHPNVELKILRCKSKTDPGTEIDLAKEPLTLLPNDLIRWRMTNHGQSDMAATLLYIDAGFGIKAIFPRAGSGTDNLLTKKEGTQQTKVWRITADPVGNEHVVLIAVPRQAGNQAPDFSFLEQSTLPLMRGADDPEAASLESPLGKLLKNAMYENGTRGGAPVDDIIDTQLSLQSWRVGAEK